MSEKEQSLTQKIQQSIKEHLPEKVGQELKAVIDQNEYRKNEINNLSDKLKRINLQVERQSETIEEQNMKISAYEKLNLKAQEIEKRERDLEIEILKVKLAAAEVSRDKTNEFVANLVRNIEFRESYQKNTFQNGYTNTNGNWVDQRNEDESTTVTKNAE